MSFRRIVLHATAVVFLVFHLTADTHRVPQLTATMSGGAVRYAGFGEVREIRLEVFDDRGRLVFDPPFTSGNVIDYALTDSSGALLKDGAYAFVVTVHDFDGAPTGKFGTFTISASRVALDNASVDRLSPDQQIAISRGRTLLPIDRIAMEMPMQVQPPQIVIAPSPAMPAQNVQPRSDVAGTGTPNVVTKWTDNAGTLGDSAITETSGNVTIGSVAASGRVNILGAATQDVFSGMGANIVSGPAMNYGYSGTTFGRGSGFFNVRPDASAVAPNPSLRFMTVNTQRMIITNIGNVGIGLTNPSEKLEVDGSVKLSAGALVFPDLTSMSTAGATLGANSFNGSQSITGSISASGAVSAATVSGSAASFSGNITSSGGAVTAGTQFNLGANRVLDADSGLGNLYAGIGAGASDAGVNNVFVGQNAGNANTAGTDNAFVGSGAGGSSNGSQNSFFGSDAGSGNTTGTNNIAVGAHAGENVTTGNDNIEIGNSGVAGDAQTVRIGSAGTQQRAFVAGIRGVTAGSDALPVVIDSNGQMGTAGGQAGTAANTPNTLVLRDASGNFAAGTITAALNGNAATATTAVSFSGSLAGEVTGTQGSTVVSNAVETDTAGAIVRRDGSGNFTAATVSLDGNLVLPATSTTGSNGVLMFGTNQGLHEFGTGNVFAGNASGNFVLTGIGNAAIGQGSMGGTTTGQFNSAVGDAALETVSTGNNNAGVGAFALANVRGGNSNTAIGVSALLNINGSSNNIGVGVNGGANLNGTSTQDIMIGNAGVAGESNTIRVGNAAHTRTFLAGVTGVTPAGAAVPVLIDGSGQLGTAGTSAPTSANTPNTVVLRDVNGNFSAGTITATLNGNAASATSATSFSGALAGEVTGTQTTTAVSNAVSFNTASAIVRRDGSGGFNAGTVNLSGDLSLTGNVKLPATSGSGNGVIMFGTKQGLHEFGTTNVFVGPGSGNFTLTGAGNVGVGFDTLLSLTTGLNNVAAGPSAVQRVTAGSNNVGFGSGALSFVTTGSNNVAIGPNALNSMDSGSSNIAIGASAGLFLASNANGNIDIDNAGTNTDGATIRIGTGQTRTFLAGVRGITTGNANAIAVVVDSAGQLGTVSSSRRFKQDIKPMGNRTDALMRLNPVTFRYKSQAADSRLQYGLIAEDVDEVYPDLVVHDDAGRPETVMYQFLAPMLLNKVQEQQRTIDDLSARLRVLEAMMNAQEQAP